MHGLREVTVLKELGKPSSSRGQGERTRREGWAVDRATHFLALIGIHLSVNWLGVKNLSGKPREADLWSGWGGGG